MTDLTRCPECARYPGKLGRFCDRANRHASSTPRKCDGFAQAPASVLRRDQLEAEERGRKRPRLRELVEQAATMPRPAGPNCSTCGHFESGAYRWTHRVGRCERWDQARGDWERCFDHWRTKPEAESFRVDDPNVVAADAREIRERRAVAKWELCLACVPRRAQRSAKRRFH
jgi:hypothetical protein